MFFFKKKFTKFKGKHLCWSLFFNKDWGLGPATLLKKRLQQNFFLWILWSVKNTFFTEHFPKTFSFSNLSRSQFHYFQRSFLHLFEPSFVRKIDKNSQFWYFFSLQIRLIGTLCHCECILYCRSYINTRNHVLFMQKY